jgi:hypothetical protein
MGRHAIRVALLLALTWPTAARGAEPTGTTLELHWEVKLADFRAPEVPDEYRQELCRLRCEELTARWKPLVPFWQLGAPPAQTMSPRPRLVIEISAPIDEAHAPIGFRLVARGVPGLPPDHELHSDTLFAYGEYFTWKDNTPGGREELIRLIASRLSVKLSPQQLLEVLKANVPVADGLHFRKEGPEEVWALPLLASDVDLYRAARFRLDCEKPTPTGPHFSARYVRTKGVYNGPAPLRPGLVRVEHEAAFENGLEIRRVFLDSIQPPPLPTAPRKGTEIAMDN